MADVIDIGFRIGERVRVIGHASYDGATGTIEKDRDQYGRYGLRLDEHLKWQREKASWRHQPVWFVPQALERVEPQCARCKGTGYVQCGDNNTGQSYRCDEWGQPCPVLVASHMKGKAQ